MVQLSKLEKYGFSKARSVGLSVLADGHTVVLVRRKRAVCVRYWCRGERISDSDRECRVRKYVIVSSTFFEETRKKGYLTHKKEWEIYHKLIFIRLF